MKSKIPVAKYIFFDFFGSALAWFLFNYFRKAVVEPQIFGIPIPLVFDTKFVFSLVLIPLLWCFLFFVNGFYKDVYRRSRLKELGSSFFNNILGVLIIFFILLLDDYINTYKDYYQLFFSLLALQFFLTYIPRFIITSSNIKKIRDGKIGFPTIIVGEGEKAYKLIKEVERLKKSGGNQFIGYVSVGDPLCKPLADKLDNLGEINRLSEIIKEHEIEEVILAIENNDIEFLSNIVSELLNLDVILKSTPTKYDYLTGKVKMTSRFGVPHIAISPEIMPLWQQKIKLFIDLIASSLALIILFPFLLIIALIIKLTSKGPIFYKQERIGRYGQPFMLYKFRSMYVDAEKNGPALSSKHDNRITPIGRFMRKTRVDEIPNFWNVLKGDMSLIGPRPERQFFIDQIIEKAPYYTQLQKVKPGITSWGQVKYGYAENVDEMVERLKYDLVYIENMTLFADFKILIYTIITVFMGKGV